MIRFLEAVLILLAVGAIIALFLVMVLRAIAETARPRAERRRAPLAFERRIRSNLGRDA